jgi:hypothetical protein
VRHAARPPAHRLLCCALRAARCAPACSARFADSARPPPCAGICDLPGISRLFDAILNTQGWLYASGRVVVGEPSHEALGYALDMALVVSLTAAMVVYLGVTERLWRALAGPSTAVAKPKEA